MIKLKFFYVIMKILPNSKKIIIWDGVDCLHTTKQGSNFDFMDIFSQRFSPWMQQMPTYDGDFFQNINICFSSYIF